jgi:hypothetical protein
MMPRFPDDHPIEILRGGRYLSRRKVLKVIANRCAWLERKIATYVEDHPNGLKNNPLYVELKALAQLVEVFEEDSRG